MKWILIGFSVIQKSAYIDIKHATVAPELPSNINQKQTKLRVDDDVFKEEASHQLMIQPDVLEALQNSVSYSSQLFVLTFAEKNSYGKDLGKDQGYVQEKKNL